MGRIKPIPVEKENIKIENLYYTCSYSGAIKVKVIKIFYDANCVLVKTGSKKGKPFIRNMNYIFDNSDMAKSAGKNWEHDERKRKRIARKEKIAMKNKNKEN